jgi:hypothetical protein
MPPYTLMTRCDRPPPSPATHTRSMSSNAASTALPAALSYRRRTAARSLHRHAPLAPPLPRLLQPPPPPHAAPDVDTDAAVAGWSTASGAAGCVAQHGGGTAPTDTARVAALAHTSPCASAAGAGTTPVRSSTSRARVAPAPAAEAAAEALARPAVDSRASARSSIEQHGRGATATTSSPPAGDGDRSGEP